MCQLSIEPLRNMGNMPDKKADDQPYMILEWWMEDAVTRKKSATWKGEVGRGNDSIEVKQQGIGKCNSSGGNGQQDEMTDYKRWRKQIFMDVRWQWNAGWRPRVKPTLLWTQPILLLMIVVQHNCNHLHLICMTSFEEAKMVEVDIPCIQKLYVCSAYCDTQPMTFDGEQREYLRNRRWE